MKTKDQINSIMERFDALKTSVHLDEKQMEMEELQIRMQDPEFWNDIEKAQSTNKKSKKQMLIFFRISPEKHKHTE